MVPDQVTGNTTILSNLVFILLIPVGLIIMKLTSFYQKSTKYRAVLFSGTFFEKYRQKYRGTFDFQVPSTGTADTLIKHRDHICTWKPNTVNFSLRVMSRISPHAFSVCQP